MKNMKPQPRKFSAIGLAIAVLSTAGVALAQEDTQELLVPHTFEPGDVISAAQMNRNFAEIVEAMNAMSVQLMQKEDSIKDPGTFAGSINTRISGGNFSLLPGADGAIGLAAADAACEVEFPGSHAELDPERLWKSAIDGGLPFDIRYWANNDRANPRSQTYGGSDCEGWSSNSEDQVGRYIKVTDSGNFSNVSSISVQYVDDSDACDGIPSNPQDIEYIHSIACYLD